MPASRHDIPLLHGREYEPPPQWWVDHLRDLNYMGVLDAYVQAALDRVIWPEHRRLSDRELYGRLARYLL